MKTTYKAFFICIAGLEASGSVGARPWPEPSLYPSEISTWRRRLDTVNDLVVKDLGLADSGERRSKSLKPRCRPMHCARKKRRNETTQRRPDHGSRFDMTIQTAVLDRNAGRVGQRCAGRAAISSRRRITPPLPLPPVTFQCSQSRAETLEEYWDYVCRIFDWGRDTTCNMILDDGGDATMFALWGYQVEAGRGAFQLHRTKKRKSSLRP